MPCAFEIRLQLSNVHAPSQGPPKAETPCAWTTSARRWCNVSDALGRIRSQWTVTAIHPKSTLLWDWFIVSLTLYTAIVIPAIIAFQPAWMRGYMYRTMDAVVYSAFAIDIVVSFHVGLVDRWGSLVVNKRCAHMPYFIPQMLWHVMLWVSMALPPSAGR